MDKYETRDCKAWAKKGRVIMDDSGVAYVHPAHV